MPIKKFKLPFVSAKTDSLFTQYGAATQSLNQNTGIRVQPREDDLKKVKEWMDKTKKSAEFWVTYDTDKAWFNFEIHVGSSVDSMSSVNLGAEKDRKKRRDTLVDLGKFTKNQLISQPDLDKFDKDNPDPKELSDLKKQLDDKAAEIKKLEKQLDDARKERVELDKHYKAIGGK